MSQVYPFTIGAFMCVVLHEGGLEQPAEKFPESFRNVEPATAIAALQGARSITTSLNPLFINTGSDKLLLDVGFGVKNRPVMGNLLPGLASIGHSPADITLIFISHFHGDHITGLFDDSDNLIYPHARYVATQAEWDAWLSRWQTSDEAADRKRFAQFSALRDQFTLLADGDTVTEGVKVAFAPGHTLGHAGLLVESGGERLLCGVDLLHREPQLTYPDWHHIYDTDPVLAADSRRNWLRQAADEKLLTLFHHLPFPGLGYVLQDGAAFKWEPIGAG